MASRSALIRSSRLLFASRRRLTTSARFLADNVNDRHHDTAEEHRKHQTSKPLNPHMTNTNSTIANEMPSVGKDAPPPEFLSSVAPDFHPKDSVPENTERMVGGTQKPGPEGGANAELEVGELAGATFKVEPKRRSGEDVNTIRARLLYQSRKRGTLESDLLLSTFADANLSTMTRHQLEQYDLFLDENDWDIYYWCTQTPPPTSRETAEGSGPEFATEVAQGKEKDTPVKRGAGEWAQTVGTFKPAYRPVPTRWRNSEILSLIRRHVKERSAGGVQEIDAGVDGKGLAQSVKGTGGGGLGFMPPVKNFDE